MKIAITGHTRGIGKALAEYFKQSGHTVIGFSKSTGCDITQESHRNVIVDSLKTCDVFINNAYAYNAQKQLLIDAIEIWKDTKNTIVNIDSKSTLVEFPPAFMKEYVDDKNQQKKLIKDRIFRARPHIINFTVGLVDTDMSSMFNAKKMNPIDIAKLIEFIISMKDSVAVQDILVEVPDLDWNDINLQ